MMEHAETIVNWPDDDIVQMDDPCITLNYVNEIRKQFPPVFEQFKAIT